MTQQKELPAVDSSGPDEDIYLVSNWTAVHKGNLTASFSLTVTDGLTLHNCQLIEKGLARWVNPPTQRLPGDDGRPIYRPSVSFASAAAKDLFIHKALAAVDEYLKETFGVGDDHSCPGGGIFDDDDEDIGGRHE
jgi:hypothetical protein